MSEHSTTCACRQYEVIAALREKLAAAEARTPSFYKREIDRAQAALAAEKLAREKAEKERDEAVTTASKLLNIAICDGCLLGEAGKHLHLSDEDIEQLAELRARDERCCDDALAAKLKTAEERLRVAVLELKACRTYFELDGRTAYVQRIDAALASAKGGGE